MTRLPLEHIRVLDLTRVRSGPTAVKQFADWGADVIMIDGPEGGSDMIGSRDGSDFQNMHRNKRSIRLDLKQESDRQIFLDLVRTADVVIENFRPAVKHRLKVDYESLREVNPRIVYASISGFGEDGPYAAWPCVDQIAQGLGGAMSVTGEPGRGPMRAGLAISDMGAGLYCAIAALIALLERDVTGVGRWVRTSLIEAQISLMDFQAARWLIDQEVPRQEGNHHPTAVPMGLFPSADGHVNIAAAGSDLFRRFCTLVGREDILADERFATFESKHRNREALREEIAVTTKTRTTAEWVRDCNAAGVPCGAVYAVDEMFDDPQIAHLAITRQTMSAQGKSVSLLAPPYRFEGLDYEVRRPAPLAGEHQDEVLGMLSNNGKAKVEE